MPLWLTNAPAVFQALVNYVLCDILNRFLFIYILIFSETLEEHIQHVSLVLPCLLDKKLFVKDKKCEFHSTSITFLVSLSNRANCCRTHQQGRLW